MYTSHLKSILSFILLLCFATIKCQNVNVQNGLALAGYDPVTYFMDGKPAKGQSAISFNNAGAIYYFSTKANLELFKKDPSKYTPQFGGWCAYAMGVKGQKVEVDPETFKIINGKLYLFYNSYLNNTLLKWNKDEIELLPKATANWQKLAK